ncbi:hypothetical protein DPMN_116453 [Dreissena polymorpha]|uniref:Uncharacterized protein n=1 Tax=Dreissena polymorpha TaxID=45954 RepID=A0A9D4KN28_DREPO|nr:hypothetical protein DPMN_116453 [Dreissena polymorpha]
MSFSDYRAGARLMITLTPGHFVASAGVDNRTIKALLLPSYLPAITGHRIHCTCFMRSAVWRQSVIVWRMSGHQLSLGNNLLFVEHVKQI